MIPVLCLLTTSQSVLLREVLLGIVMKIISNDPTSFAILANGKIIENSKQYLSSANDSTRESGMIYKRLKNCASLLPVFKKNSASAINV